jgi:hypothetical protein
MPDKRKADSALKQVKRKGGHPAAASKALETVASIGTLGKQIVGSLEHANGIVDLLAVVENANAPKELQQAAIQGKPCTGMCD